MFKLFSCFGKPPQRNDRAASRTLRIDIGEKKIPPYSAKKNKISESSSSESDLSSSYSSDKHDIKRKSIPNNEETSPSLEDTTEYFSCEEPTLVLSTQGRNKQSEEIIIRPQSLSPVSQTEILLKKASNCKKYAKTLKFDFATPPQNPVKLSRKITSRSPWEICIAIQSCLSIRL